MAKNEFVGMLANKCKMLRNSHINAKRKKINAKNGSSVGPILGHALDIRINECAGSVPMGVAWLWWFKKLKDRAFGGRPHCKGMAIGVARRGARRKAVSVRSVFPCCAVFQSATPADRTSHRSFVGARASKKCVLAKERPAQRKAKRKKERKAKRRVGTLKKKKKKPWRQWRVLYAAEVLLRCTRRQRKGLQRAR